MSFLFLTFVGSTGNKFLPPDFCQSLKDLDLNVVMPTFPRFFPGFLLFSLIFSHSALDIPLGTASEEGSIGANEGKFTYSGMYSMVMVLLFRVATLSFDPVKDENALASVMKAARSTRMKVFIIALFVNVLQWELSGRFGC